MDNKLKEKIPVVELDKNSVDNDWVEFRSRVFAILQHLIHKKATQLCKEYCYQNRFEYICTVDARWGALSDSSSLCDWGNASYVWITDDLFKKNRLQLLQRESEESVIRYFSKVIHSGVFKERFKDWRFQRRIRVPDYIKVIDQDAQKIYWRLSDNDVAENIAQLIGRSLKEVQGIISNIHEALRQRNKLHLLNINRVLSLTGLYSDDTVDTNTVMSDWEGVCDDLPIDEQARRKTVMQAYGKLTWKEQYIVDAMIIDGLKARSVVAALKSMKQSLDDSGDYNPLTEQQVYYFLRKTLAKIKTLASLDSKK